MNGSQPNVPTAKCLRTPLSNARKRTTQKKEWRVKAQVPPPVVMPPQVHQSIVDNEGFQLVQKYTTKGNTTTELQTELPPVTNSFDILQVEENLQEVSKGGSNAGTPSYG